MRTRRLQWLKALYSLHAVKKNSFKYLRRDFASSEISGVMSSVPKRALNSEVSVLVIDPFWCSL